MILDEPTNHLDIDSRENLEEALKEFKGTLLLISHDRYFINQLANKVSEIRDGKVVNYLGDYEYYKEKCHELYQEMAKVQQIKISTPKKECQEKSVKSKANPYKLNQLEEDIKALEAKQKEITYLLSEMGSDYVRCMELEEERNKVQSHLDDAMEKWLQLQEE